MKVLVQDEEKIALSIRHVSGKSSKSQYFRSRAVGFRSRAVAVSMTIIVFDIGIRLMSTQRIAKKERRLIRYKSQKVEPLTYRNKGERLHRCRQLKLWAAEWVRTLFMDKRLLTVEQAYSRQNDGIWST